MEDDSGRVTLSGPGIKAHIPCLVTGVVSAIRGYVDDTGAFKVFTFRYEPVL